MAVVAGGSASAGGNADTAFEFQIYLFTLNMNHMHPGTPMHTRYQLCTTRAHYGNNGDYCCVVKNICHRDLREKRGGEDEEKRGRRRNVPDLRDAVKGVTKSSTCMRVCVCLDP